MHESEKKFHIVQLQRAPYICKECSSLTMFSAHYRQTWRQVVSACKSLLKSFAVENHVEAKYNGPDPSKVQDIEWKICEYQYICHALISHMKEKWMSLSLSNNNVYPLQGKKLKLNDAHFISSFWAMRLVKELMEGYTRVWIWRMEILWQSSKYHWRIYLQKILQVLWYDV